MFKWIGKRIASGAIQTGAESVKDHAVLISAKILEIIKAPSERLLGFWEGLDPEDRELFKIAALSAAKLSAKAIIAAETGKKFEF